MSEQAIVLRTPDPRTRRSLAADLLALGVQPGMTLLAHSSLSSIGWVSGGPVAVVQAFLDALGPAGTLVMPTHTSANSDPSRWQNPPVPETWWETIRMTMPAFDPSVTPSTAMGSIVEVFRTWPGTLRSGHPQVSFAAFGPSAGFITSNHSLVDALGDASPLARVYDLDGSVLLLGVGYDRNTSFHLAEYRTPGTMQLIEGASVLENGLTRWKTFSDLDWNAEPFAEIGAAFESNSPVSVGLVGSAASRLFRQRPAVDFAGDWLSSARSIERA
jgi:aminoglycoside 3-N-acetyltransferase